MLRAALLAAVLLGAATAHAAPALTKLYSFQPLPDAVYPAGNIAIDRAGNFYGAGISGGGAGGGAIFEVSPPAAGQFAWTETVLFSLAGRYGTLPLGGVISTPGGDLYSSSAGGGSYNCGTVFALDKTISGTRRPRIIREFRGGTADGCEPRAALNRDRSGKVYGSTLHGGAYNAGTVFKLTRVPGELKWTETMIWSFDGATDGSPESQMIVDPAGNLYGTSETGGAQGNGTVWRLTHPAPGSTAWTRTVLWTFAGAPDGANPGRGPLARDTAGNLYGTCQFGGPKRGGTVFELSPPPAGQTSWTETTLWSFHAGIGGDNGVPTSGMVFTRTGSLIGVTNSFPTSRVFALRPPSATEPTWTMHRLWRFTGREGSDPEFPVLISHNKIFGTTFYGGTANNGTIWELTP